MASQLTAEAQLIGQFPRLASSPFEITSDCTRRYNCIAWAAHDQNHFWWPGAFWPKGAKKKVTRNAFITAFGTKGFKRSKLQAYEEGYDLIVLYEDADGRPTHAARLLPDGRWSSKLGSSHDIAHTLEGLEGQRYGKPAIYLRRKIPAS